MMNLTVKLFSKGPYSLGEGIQWDWRVSRLYWLDIEKRKLHYQSEDQSVNTVDLPGMPGTIVLTENSDCVVLATDVGILTYSFSTGVIEKKVDYPEDANQSRFNDGKCDPDGNLWVGTMRRNGSPGGGTLYRMNDAFEFEPILKGLSIPNGLCWSHDGREFYHIDSPTRVIRAYAIKDNKLLASNSRIAVTIPDGWGYPDGMTMDSDGNLWVAHWGGHCVACYNPIDGKVIDRITLPTPNITSCWFGGNDLKTLYVTSALGSEDAGWTNTEEYPQSGAVFELRPGPSGVHGNLGKI